MKSKGREDNLGGHPRDREEVACPVVVHNTTFKPLDHGLRAKSERNKSFCIKQSQGKVEVREFFKQRCD